MKIVLTALLTLATLGLTGPLMAFEPDKNDALQLDVARAIVNIRKADPGIETFFEQAAGYAVFPSIGKGGAIVGGDGLMRSAARFTGDDTILARSVDGTVIAAARGGDLANGRSIGLNGKPVEMASARIPRTGY